MKLLRGDYRAVSRKDLTACAKVLRPMLTKGLEETITKFKSMMVNGVYIPYTKNKSGLGHHSGMSSCRRPIKCYDYIIEFLKGVRGSYDPAKSYVVLVNSTTNRLPKGVRKCSKGSRFREDAKKHCLVLRQQL